MDHVNEVAWFDMLDNLMLRYAALHGTKPINVSHWDPSSSTRGALLEFVPPTVRNAVDYIYPYTIDREEEVLCALGFDPTAKCCLFTPSGTISSLCAVNLITHLNPISVTLLAPYYFAVPHQLKLHGTVPRETFLQRIDGSFHIPDSLDGAHRFGEVLVVTNPVYSTSVYYDSEDVERLERYLAGGGTILADETLATSGSELAHSIGHHPSFLGIYAPHKAISVNAVKFSVVVADRSHTNHLFQWADVLFGGLSSSSALAVDHFLSPQYARAHATFIRAMYERFLWLCEKVVGMNGVTVDRNPSGHFVSCYISQMSPECAYDPDFLWEVIEATGAAFIPGIRNHFDPKWGFSFRINLAMLDDSRSQGAVIRLLRRLARQ